MEKKYEKYVLSFIAILVIVALVLAFTGFTFNNSNIKTTTNVVLSQVEESGFKSITNGNAAVDDVAIDLKPHEVENGLLNVDIGVNTHGIDLEGFNLKEIIVLEYNGKSINPVSAPSLSGHHNSGTLTFEVQEDISEFTIKIIGIPKIEERIFVWRKE